MQIYDILSFADPDPHGSAFILVSWTRFRIRIGNTDPQSETNADPQHWIHLCVCMDSFRHCCYVVGTFTSAAVSGTDRIRAGARRLQSGQLQVLAAPCISKVFRVWPGSWNNTIPRTSFFNLWTLVFISWTAFSIPTTALSAWVVHLGERHFPFLKVYFHPVCSSRERHFPSR